MWVSCKQHTYGYCFCIHSASLCLLVGSFNPFIFSIIMGKYIPIAILLIALNCYIGSFFFFLSPSLVVFSCGLLTMFIVVFGWLFFLCVCLLYLLFWFVVLLFLNAFLTFWICLLIFSCLLVLISFLPMSIFYLYIMFIFNTDFYLLKFSCFLL